MTTEAQFFANRRNSQLSTGPTTEPGKLVSSQNSRRHGLFSKRIVLPDEDPAEFDDLVRELVADRQPVGRLEERLVERIALCFWRLDRIARVEADVFAMGYLQHEQVQRRGMLGVVRDLGSAREDSEFDRAEQEINELLEKLEGSERERLLGLLFIREERNNTFTKLGRYETAISRELQRVLHELERLQERRRGGNVPVPVVVDMNVSLPST